MQKIIIELIDTLWNVNSLETGIAFNVYGELIDTLWNVNSKPTSHQKKSSQN